MSRKLRVVGWTMAKIAISMTLLYLAARRIDLHSFGEDIRGMRFWWLVPALLQFFLIPLLGGARWKIVLDALGTAFALSSALRLFWIGMIFSQVLPSASGGDAVRVILAWRGGLPLSRTVHSVLLERAAVVVSLSGLVVLMQCLRPAPLHGTAIEIIMPLLLAGALAALVLLLFADHIASVRPAWPPLAALSRLSLDARRIFLSKAGMKLFLLCLVTHLNFALASLWLANSLGLQLSISDTLYLVSIVTLATAVPVSIGGWGVREGATVMLFGTVGVMAHQALAFSVSSGLCIAAVSLTGMPLLWAAKKASHSTAPRPGEAAGLAGSEGRVQAPDRG